MLNLKIIQQLPQHQHNTDTMPKPEKRANVTDAEQTAEPMDTSGDNDEPSTSQPNETNNSVASFTQVSYQ